MENLVIDMHSNLAEFYSGKRVLVTGHTGFKGGWLTEWLLMLGAKVTGLSLPPATELSLFEQLKLADRCDHRIGDIRDLECVKKAVSDTSPDLVFHLAAQALVRPSYEAPVETYATNTMGTINILEALRGLTKPCAAVFITTDKCYENQEWHYGYRETDPLGGIDPYSSSKAAAEIAIAAYRRSFFNDHSIKIASARAGNVIGGGDWALDRIVPDCIRALQDARPISIRNKMSTRPWQHVLEPLSGYLWLAACMSSNLRHQPSHICSAFNFGPNNESNRTVQELVQEILTHWPGEWEDRSDPNAVHEATLLHLSVDKANALLGWGPVWGFKTTVEKTVQWYRYPSHELTINQIKDYTLAARNKGIEWTR